MTVTKSHVFVVALIFVVIQKVTVEMSDIANYQSSLEGGIELVFVLGLVKEETSFIEYIQYFFVAFIKCCYYLIQNLLSNATNILYNCYVGFIVSKTWYGQGTKH